jgi:hypothetical protein
MLHRSALMAELPLLRRHSSVPHHLCPTLVVGSCSPHSIMGESAMSNETPLSFVTTHSHQGLLGERDSVAVNQFKKCPVQCGGAA